MSGSGKGLLGLWLYRSGEHEWAVKGGSPIHKCKSVDLGGGVGGSNSSSPSHHNHTDKKQSLKMLNKIRKDELTPSDRTSIIFTLKNQVGGLARALQVFQELGINVLYIEFQQYNETKQQV